MALHAMAFVLTGDQFRVAVRPEIADAETVIATEVAPPPETMNRPETTPPPVPDTDLAMQPLPAKPVATPVTKPQPAIQEAPPPPTAEEWAFASTYKLKNSKGYRYTWGQQVRSMMGTAVEGPDQGAVRFEVEIAPDGTIVRVETLWTTSAVAEQRARVAIQTCRGCRPRPPASH